MGGEPLFAAALESKAKAVEADIAILGLLWRIRARGKRQPR